MATRATKNVLDASEATFPVTFWNDGSGNLTPATVLEDGNGNAIAKAEDTAHANADPGLPVLVRRIDTPASSAGTSGDYAVLNTDSKGKLWVAGGKVDDAAYSLGADSVLGVGGFYEDPYTSFDKVNSADAGILRMTQYRQLLTAKAFGSFWADNSSVARAVDLEAGSGLTSGYVALTTSALDGATIGASQVWIRIPMGIAGYDNITLAIANTTDQATQIELYAWLGGRAANNARYRIYNTASLAAGADIHYHPITVTSDPSNVLLPELRNPMDYLVIEFTPGGTMTSGDLELYGIRL